MSSTPLFKKYFNLSKKSLIILKLISISAGIVYGGHKLVQFVTPTEEELLKVKLLQNGPLIKMNRNFLQNYGIIISRDLVKRNQINNINFSNFGLIVSLELKQF